MSLKTTRDLELRISAWTAGVPSLKVPQGADVLQIRGAGGGYAIRDPRPYGASRHDATHYYFWVPTDAVIEH
jgi:hypothetical protein